LCTEIDLTIDDILFFLTQNTFISQP